MLSVYIGQVISNKPLIELVSVALGLPKKDWGRWSDKAFLYLDKPLFNVVEDPAEADYFMLPHYYNGVLGESQYLADFEVLAKRNNKYIIVIYPGDSSVPVSIGRAIVFRNSQYRQMLRPNEIVMPAFAEDLLDGRFLWVGGFLKLETGVSLGYEAIFFSASVRCVPKRYVSS
jgi:hypothetical protein